jgi:SAM-dependent methyltransferase
MESSQQHGGYNPRSEPNRAPSDQSLLAYTGEFRSLGDFCLHLMHKKAYEQAAVLIRDLNVLDLGCNNGWGTHILAGSATKIVGLDVSEKVLTDARRRFGAEVDFRLYDGRHLPFEDKHFDAVVSCQVLEHVSEPNEYLAEIARVLVPDGRAIFTTPNAAIRLDPGMPPWNTDHIHEFVAPELAELLQAHFDTVSISGLFARDELYRVEADRCARAKLAARASGSASFLRRGSLTDYAKSAARMLLPEAAIDILRKLRARTFEVKFDIAMIHQYSTADFFYDAKELDRALDLMAVCGGPTVK